MQMFRKPVKTARQGDRVGICVTGLDASTIERGILAAPNSVPLLSSAICLVKKVRYFRHACQSKQKFHITIGHTTVVATVMFFGAAELKLHMQKQETLKKTSFEHHPERKDTVAVSTLLYDERSAFPAVDFPFDNDFEYQDSICASEDDVNARISSSVSLKKQQASIESESLSRKEYEPMETNSSGPMLRYGEEAIQYALLIFQHPILVPLNTLAIGSRLETDARESVVSATHCRIAFFGPVLCPSADSSAFAPTSTVTKDKPRIFHWKTKEAEILRLVDVNKDSGLCTEAIGWKLFSKEAGISKYLGLKLETVEGDVVGYIHSSFGSTGKFKIKFPLGILNLKSGSKLFVRYKRFIYDKTKSIHQDDIPYTPLLERVIVHPVSENLKNFGDGETLVHGDDKPGGEEHDIRGYGADSDIEDYKSILEIPDANSASENMKVAAEGSTADAADSQTIDDVVNSVSAAAVTCSSLDLSPHEEDIGVPEKTRTGTIDSIRAAGDGGCVCITSGAFRMEENIREHIGAIATTSSGKSGSLVGPYAKMGKCKIEFSDSTGIMIGENVLIVLSK